MSLKDSKTAIPQLELWLEILIPVRTDSLALIHTKVWMTNPRFFPFLQTGLLSKKYG